MWVAHGAWSLGGGTMVDAAHPSAILGTALLVSDDGELHLVSKLLCKPSIYLEGCVKFCPPCFQEDRAEVEEVLHGQLGQQWGHVWYWV